MGKQHFIHGVQVVDYLARGGELKEAVPAPALTSSKRQLSERHQHSTQTGCGMNVQPTILGKAGQRNATEPDACATLGLRVGGDVLRMVLAPQTRVANNQRKRIRRLLPLKHKENGVSAACAHPPRWEGAHIPRCHGSQAHLERRQKFREALERTTTIRHNVRGTLHMQRHRVSPRVRSRPTFGLSLSNNESSAIVVASFMMSYTRFTIAVSASDKLSSSFGSSKHRFST